ncbi:hypothetical protein ALC57_12705 [Trachymyrmex cornetzi]|uniref:Uncharacterized protein n=1 Tax=Trachymyrmex cornetzi TaxID=471704 RepID=A0A195DQM1_9HYME|nr:hypothetical protein ALC57_12705 [Trachymyrmex cornetzi]
MAIRYIVMLTTMLAVIYVKAESDTVGQNPQQTLVAPAVSSEVAPLKLYQAEAVSGEVAETQPRNKRAPVLLLKKALLGSALLGAGALGAGALGAGALGAGALGAGVLGAGVLGGGLYGAKQ